MKHEADAPETGFLKCPCCNGSVAVIAAERVFGMDIMARATVRCTDCQLSMTRMADTMQTAKAELMMRGNRRRGQK